VKSLLPFLSIDRKREIVGILLCTLGILVLVSLGTHRGSDDLWFIDDIPETLAPEELLSNQGGVVGAAVSYMLLNLFGFAALFVPLWLAGKGWALLAHRPMASYLRSIWLIFLGVYILGVVFGVPGAGRGDPLYDPGSTLGGFVAHWTSLGLVTLFGSVGGIIVALGILAVVIAMLISWRPETLTWLDPARWLAGLRSAAAFLSDVGPSRRSKNNVGESDGPGLRQRASAFWSGVQVLFGTRELADAAEPQQQSSRRVRLVKPEPSPVPVPAAQFPQDELPLDDEEVPLPAIRPANTPRKRVDVAGTPLVPSGNYQFPSLATLEAPAGLQHSVSRGELEATTVSLQQTLETFGVGVDGPIRQFPGPVITRFEFKPAAGIKVNQVLGLADDLALALSAKRIRIIAPIPGKPAVGIEIPNREPQMVYLSEIISSDEFARPEWRLPLALGKTTSGQPYVADLARMPHLLIAGATGSGKSVCINAVITSMNPVNSGFFNRLS
jgi:S-DNA-T family DNA segregation ATPase FtsK/SpoIIIE